MGCLGADGGRYPVSWSWRWCRGLCVGGGVELIAGLSVPVRRNFGLPERCPPARVEHGSQPSAWFYTWSLGAQSWSVIQSWP